MKKLLVWLTVVVMAGCCTHNNVIHSAERLTLVENLEDMTVAMVEYRDNLEDLDDLSDLGTIRAYCTGVWVDRDVILTANHCVRHLGNPNEDDDDTNDIDEEATPWNATGQKAFYAVHKDIPMDEKDKPRHAHSATVMATDMKHDLALVKVDVKDMPQHLVANVFRGQIHDGEGIHAIGHTVGLWWTYMHGFVSAERITSDNPLGQPVKVLQVSAPVYKGNSGGGAFTQDGQLVGVCSYVHRWPGLAFYIHRDHIVNFLTANRLL